MINTCKQRLKEGKVALGVQASLGAPFSAELLAHQGYDWVLVDNQHGSWDRQSSSLAFMACRAGGATPITRVPQNDFYAIGRLLDEGPLGIIVPMVENQEEAEKVAFAAHYPPVGGRSIGITGAMAWGPDYLDWINDELLVMIQIESRGAVERAEEIMAVDGIDGCWLGPADLAASLGHERNTPQHDQAVMRMIEACKKCGKASGIAAGTVEQALKWAKAGCTFLTLGTDARYVVAGAKADIEALEELRG